MSLMWQRLRSVAWILLAVCAGVIWCRAVAAAGPDSRRLMADAKRSLGLHNSAHLASDPAGNLHALAVRRTDTHEELIYLRIADAGHGDIDQQPILRVRHDDHPSAGIGSYAISIDRLGHAHAYAYTRQYQGRNTRFREIWLRRNARIKRWGTRVIRDSENSMGGAGVFDPHVQVTQPNRLHLTAYMHNSYGEIHRVRYRLVDPRQSLIYAVPRPAGKADSKVSDLLVDNRGVAHIAYSATRALLGGRPEAGYPDAGIAYTTYQNHRWSPTSVVLPRIGDTTPDSRHSIQSIAIRVPDPTQVEIAATYRGPRAPPGGLLYFQGNSAGWRQMAAYQVDESEGEPESGRSHAVFLPTDVAAGLPVGRLVVLTDRATTKVLSLRPNSFDSTARLPGRTEGVALIRGELVLLVWRVQEDLQLVHLPLNVTRRP